mmetsp:Transcript_11886/g.24145  ORF Transcript_11886/g.24145 Transcript_11886/m.24145 type:complete len:167 (-) Transcript_11886:257-757(-)
MMDSLDPHLDAGHTMLSNSEDKQANTSTRSTRGQPHFQSAPTDSVKKSGRSAQHLRPSKAIQSALKCWQWLGQRIGVTNPIVAFVVPSICLELAVISGRALFLYGILFVLLLQISQVAEPWFEYVASDPEIRNMLTFIRGWRRYFIDFVKRHAQKKQDPARAWWHW